MFVIDVIPLARGTALESLTYFSSTEYQPGTFVTIPVRGKTMTGIVAHASVVSSTKTALKAATFSLRKLPEQKQAASVSDHLLKAAKTLQGTHPLQLGALLFSLLPPDVRSGAVPYPVSKSVVNDEDSTPQLLTALADERYMTYQSIIRSAFAHRGSVLLVVPTTPAVDRLYAALSGGIEERVICFASSQTKRERLNAYRAFSDMSHTTLTITTPNFAYLDRPDCTHIIIEEASSASYNTITRPSFDHREMLRILAQIAGRALILGDTVHRTEDEHKRREDIYQTYGENPRRLSLPAGLNIIHQSDGPTAETPFELFSPDLQKRIKTALEGRKNVFLFAARRGLAPVVACLDCGFIFRCPDSGTPYSLLRTHNEKHEEVRWFLSGTSGKRVRAADTCTECGSWRLRERGIGIQHIHDECKKLFPDTPIITFDHTTATTHKRSLAIMAELGSSKGAILLGTQMVLPYLSSHIHLTAIVSLDAVRSIPTWRADESLFKLLLSLRERTIEEVVVQTRSETDDLLVYAGRGAIERFYDDEITLRKMLNYPPFAYFIFLTWQGNPNVIEATEKLIKGIIEPHQVESQFYTNPRSLPQKPIRHCLIRIFALAEHPTLIDDLRRLPPYIAVSINPDRIV